MPFFAIRFIFHIQHNNYYTHRGIGINYGCDKNDIHEKESGTYKKNK
jgi:hypothetical protein